MTKRQLALETIRIEWALNGKDTQQSIRAFVENRISMEARNKVAAIGLKQYYFKNRFKIKQEA
jgi:hypothetical protein